MNRKINNLLLFIALLLATANVMAGSLTINDSTGVEKKDGKVFILHKVDPKETLFSISKKYGSSVDDLKKYNPTATGLKVGQIIKVPSKTSASKTTSTKVTQTVDKTTTSSQTKNPKTHKVEAKETLYSISKKYGVSVDDLKKANPSIAAGLKPGQVISIPSAGGQTTIKTETTIDKTTTNPTSKTDTSKTVNSDKNSQNVSHVIKDVENNNTNANASKTQENLANIKPTSIKSTEGGYTKITETGVAEMMDDNTNNPKYLALHRTAAVGTIIEVMNQSNNQKIFVKVIGPLTDPAESNVIIRLSQKAFQRLSGDKQMKVEISYIP